MLIPGTTSWSDTFVVFVAASALVLIPGLAAGLSLRLRPLAALGLAPLLSTTCVSVSAVVASGIGVRWGVAPLILGIVAMAAVCAVLGVFTSRANVVLSARGGPLSRWRELDPAPRFDTV